MERETEIERERDARTPEPYEPPGVAWEEAFEAVAASCDPYHPDECPVDPPTP